MTTEGQSGRCPRCGLGIDDDGDGNCAVCYRMSNAEVVEFKQRHSTAEPSAPPQPEPKPYEPEFGDPQFWNVLYSHVLGGSTRQLESAQNMVHKMLNKPAASPVVERATANQYPTGAWGAAEPVASPQPDMGLPYFVGDEDHPITMGAHYGITRQSVASLETILCTCIPGLSCTGGAVGNPKLDCPVHGFGKPAVPFVPQPPARRLLVMCPACNLMFGVGVEKTGDAAQGGEHGSADDGGSKMSSLLDSVPARDVQLSRPATGVGVEVPMVRQDVGTDESTVGVVSSIPSAEPATMTAAHSSVKRWVNDTAANWHAKHFPGRRGHWTDSDAECFAGYANSELITENAELTKRADDLEKQLHDQLETAFQENAALTRKIAELQGRNERGTEALVKSQREVADRRAQLAIKTGQFQDGGKP